MSVTVTTDPPASVGAAPEAPARRALVLVNANSRGGRTPEPHLAALVEGGLSLLRRDCPSRERIGDIIRETRNEVDCVVLAGGDGTMAPAAIALRDTGLPLGILPLGTGNDLARTLGIPEDPAGAAAVILAGHTRQIDVGTVNGRPFFNVASVGLTVEITRRLSQANKRRFGRFAYLFTALKVATGHKRFSAIIRLGAVIHRVRTMQVTIGNGRFYGAGLVVSDTATIDDHLLDLYSMELPSRWRLLFMSRAFAAGQHEDIADIRTARSPTIEVVTRVPQHVSADGEIVTLTPARFSVLPNAVTVYAP